MDDVSSAGRRLMGTLALVDILNLQTAGAMVDNGRKLGSVTFLSSRGCNADCFRIRVFGEVAEACRDAYAMPTKLDVQCFAGVWSLVAMRAVLRCGSST